MELDREISEKDLSIIKMVLASDLSYAEALAIFGAWFDRPDTLPATLKPLAGIEQFQAEDR